MSYFLFQSKKQKRKKKKENPKIVVYNQIRVDYSSTLLRFRKGMMN